MIDSKNNYPKENNSIYYYFYYFSALTCAVLRMQRYYIHTFLLKYEIIVFCGLYNYTILTDNTFFNKDSIDLFFITKKKNYSKESNRKLRLMTAKKYPEESNKDRTVLLSESNK